MVKRRSQPMDVSVPVARQSFFFLGQCLQFRLQSGDCVVFVATAKHIAEAKLGLLEKTRDFIGQLGLSVLLPQKQSGGRIKIIGDAFGYTRLSRELRKDTLLELAHDVAESVLMFSNLGFRVGFSFLGDFEL